MLAQKTAAAAADISTMIQDNMNKAKLGSEISSQIAGEVRELDGWIEEVHAVSSGQLQYLQELKSISADLERSTESTASNAEKNASTAEELQGQVHMLQQAIDDINRMVTDGESSQQAYEEPEYYSSAPAAGTSDNARHSDHYHSNGNGSKTHTNGHKNGHTNGHHHSPVVTGGSLSRTSVGDIRNILPN